MIKQKYCKEKLDTGHSQGIFVSTYNNTFTFSESKFFFYPLYEFNPLTPDQICNSPYCQPYNSYNVTSGNLLLVQLIIPKLTFFFILITYLVVIVLIL